MLIYSFVYLSTDERQWFASCRSLTYPSRLVFSASYHFTFSMVLIRFIEFFTMSCLLAFSVAIVAFIFCSLRFWPTIKYNERCLAVMETKMLYWSSGVILHYHFRNEAICDRYGIIPILDKLRGRDL